MNQSNEINELAAALSKAQGLIEHASTDATAAATTTRQYKYATLAAVWSAIRDPLSKNGLSVVQITDDHDPDAVTVVTRLMHSGGQWIEGRLRMKPAQNTPQAIGSCITYARRYALMAIVGIAPADDDGKEASEGGEPSQDKSYTGYGQSRPENPARGTSTPGTVITAAGEKREDLIANKNRVIGMAKKRGLTPGALLEFVGVTWQEFDGMTDPEDVSKLYMALADYCQRQDQAPKAG